MPYNLVNFAICCKVLLIINTRFISGHEDPKPVKILYDRKPCGMILTSHADGPRGKQPAGNQRGISTLVGPSETKSKTGDIDEDLTNWLAGLIDGDGGFYISKAGYISCEITMHSKEVQTLYFIKSILGGYVHPRVKADAYRWRLHKTSDIMFLLNLINGRIRTKSKQEQLKKIFLLKNITYIEPNKLTVDNSWLSGFFSAEGSFRLSESRLSPSISIGQKEKNILEDIKNVWGGSVNYAKTWDGWLWVCGGLAQLNILTTYFNNYSLRNPYKIAKLKGFERYLRMYGRGDHLDPVKKLKVIRFIQLYQGKI